MLLTGCSHFLVRDSYVYGGPNGFYPKGTLSDYDTIIVAYEQKAVIPTNLSHTAAIIAAQCDTNDIAMLYAARSACRVRHDPAFPGVRVCVMVMDEFTTRENLYMGWFMPAVLTPFCLVVDCLRLPIQSVRTIVVSQEDIDEALLDLKKARNLGYARDQISRGWFSCPATHLDRLGYHILDREDAEQGASGYAPAGASPER